MLTRVFLGTAAIALLAGSAMAQDAQQQPAAAAKPAEKKVCRNIVPTGTIMARRFCLTKTEWARLNDINEKSASIALNRRGGALDPATMGE